MTYPTLEEVEQANREQLARWHRFLPSPGLSHHGPFERGEISAEDVGIAIQLQATILGRIEDRFRMLGGMTAELSKRIDW